MCRSMTFVPVSPATGDRQGVSSCPAPTMPRAWALARCRHAGDRRPPSRLTTAKTAGHPRQQTAGVWLPEGHSGRGRWAGEATSADNAAFLVEECVGVKRLESPCGVEARPDTAVPCAPVDVCAGRVCWPVLPVCARRHKTPAASAHTVSTFRGRLICRQGNAWARAREAETIRQGQNATGCLCAQIVCALSSGEPGCRGKTATARGAQCARAHTSWEHH